MLKTFRAIGLLVAALGIVPSVSFAEDTTKEDTAKSAKNEEGFVSLFDGESLKGWKGDTKGYQAKDGYLMSKKESGGNLLTEKEYSDFILRFEFRLTPGSNNGLGIRLPEKGHMATDGMELQILDDGHEMYKNIKDYQFHGSLYGVVPAKQGFKKPTGEWNQQEVIAKGRDLEVILNGETILKTNLDEAAKNPVDGAEHPGLKREKGYIGFLGHGAEVHIRNIRIKDLSADSTSAAK